MENMNESYRWGGRPHGGMGMILPLLAIPLVIGFVKHASRRYMYLHGEGGQGPQGGPGSFGGPGGFASRWENGVPPMFAELHRRAHAAEAKAAEAKAAEAKAAEPKTESL